MFAPGFVPSQGAVSSLAMARMTRLLSSLLATDTAHALQVECDEKGRVENILLAGPVENATKSIKAHLENHIRGVTRGFLVYMQVVGVGFRVSKEVQDVSYIVDGGQQA
jgi:hypothetical protein